MKLHHYKVCVKWEGNLGKGTQSYSAYSRNFLVRSDDHDSTIPGSADPAFRGDAKRWNPEELLLAATSACHKLWYLHLCAVNGISVVSYEDSCEAVMEEGHGDKEGKIVSITLSPTILVDEKSDTSLAMKLHEDAHKACFIANSLNFPVQCKATILVEGHQARPEDAPR